MDRDGRAHAWMLCLITFKVCVRMSVVEFIISTLSHLQKVGRDRLFTPRTYTKGNRANIFSLGSE